MQYKKGIALASCCIFVIVISFIMPVYGEVKSLKTDKTFYIKESTIIFSGTVDKNDFRKQVNIVIHDPQNNFVGITGGFSGDDNTFQVNVKTTDQQFHDRFATKGIYNATAFITTEQNGTVVSFDFSPDGSTVIHVQGGKSTEEIKPSAQNGNTVTSKEPTPKQEAIKNEKSIYDKINERIEYAKKLKESQTRTPTKIDLSEGITLQAYGDTLASQVTTASEQQPPFIFIAAIAGSGVVSAISIYILKNRGRRPNDKQSNKNVNLGKSGTGSEDDYPLVILKNRLANGEITIEEYNEIKNALKEQ